MNERLFGWSHAFDHPVTVWITGVITGLLLLAPVLIRIASGRASTTPEARQELWSRYRSWLVLAPLMVAPILLGAFWTMLVAALLALLCYREFARMTGAFRDRLVSLVVVLGILLVFFATLDHWYGLFVAAFPLAVVAICIAGLLTDAPKGYLQRVALGVLAFMMCGAGFGHFAYFANDPDYRPVMLMLVVGIQLNDVFAFCAGKLFGRTKFVPNTSPNKTLGGAVGAALLTMPMVAGIAHFTFRGTGVDELHLLLLLGLIVSVLGQLGDLMLSAIKRDVGIKDTGSLIPGHGGLLDRFDSTLLVAPAAFHYVGYHVGIGLDEPVRILTG